jgi:hypothetical protein
MNTYTLSQTPTIARHIFVRYRWIIAICLLSVVIALATYRFTSVPAAPKSVISRPHVSLEDPAQQGVQDYLRAHSVAQPLSASAVTRDPAQQSVMDYLRAHQAVETQSLDPTQQGVMDYLRAHNH